MGPDTSEQNSGNYWRISAAPDDAGALVELIANDQLRHLPVSAKGSGWETAGAQASFNLDLRGAVGPLTAGWYELRGWLAVEGGGAAQASLHLQYKNRSALAGVEVMLPEPDEAGRIDALLLFFEDVEALMFIPGIHPLRFRMREFCLRRVSRAKALRMMLGGPVDARRGCIGRAAAWARMALRRGLKRATDGLYADYCGRIRPRGQSEYAVWVRKYDSIGNAELDVFRKRAQALGDQGPLLSVLLRVGDGSGLSLRHCLDSLLGQAWQRWEACIVVTEYAASNGLAEYAARDARVRIVAAESSGQDLLDVALVYARGEFVVQMEPEGALRPHALLRVAEIVAADPKLAIAYSDEDEIDDSGVRSKPDFKPDWNPDLLRSQNYVGHFVAIRTTLVREAGGFRAGFGDSGAYDLILRCSEKLTPERIHHLPEILYHGPAAIGKATTKTRDGEEAFALRAVAEHLQRLGSAAVVHAMAQASGLHRVRWPLPEPMPKISLIIPTRDRVKLLRRCVESILAKTTYPDFELLVVDNQSGDAAALEYLKALGGRERVRVLRYDAPFNYSALNNWAAHQCDGHLLGLVNNDVEVISTDWLEEMAGFAVRPNTGAVGAMLYYPDDTIQHAGMLLGIHGAAGHAYVGMPRGYRGYESRGLVAQNLTAITGACLLVRRELFEAVGGLDEQLPVEFNDVDFCLRVQQQGYRNVWTPFAELYHHESASRVIGDASARNLRSSGLAFMLERWGVTLRDDPAYNPNLSLQSTNFELAFPPRGELGKCRGVLN